MPSFIVKKTSSISVLRLRVASARCASQTSRYYQIDVFKMEAFPIICWSRAFSFISNSVEFDNRLTMPVKFAAIHLSRFSSSVNTSTHVSASRRKPSLQKQDSPLKTNGSTQTQVSLASRYLPRRRSSRQRPYAQLVPAAHTLKQASCSELAASLSRLPTLAVIGSAHTRTLVVEIGLEMLTREARQPLSADRTPSKPVMFTSARLKLVILAWIWFTSPDACLLQNRNWTLLAASVRLSFAVSMTPERTWPLAWKTSTDWETERSHWRQIKAACTTLKRRLTFTVDCWMFWPCLLKPKTAKTFTQSISTWIWEFCTVSVQMNMWLDCCEMCMDSLIWVVWRALAFWQYRNCWSLMVS
ncbi:Hypothetical_protein [Hexamita inflata]|uniref:Hypothetical_protein n=1 Tax=Hexamita inflata TaxID=28002 RepID=A0AA86TXR7_9EUKA|nr:Hypothetical protein HINF_LOCUS18647 [Hexamita inflata]